MSLDFNRYPHLVSQIEVFPVDTLLPTIVEGRRSAEALLEMNSDTSTAHEFYAYFRYSHLNPHSKFEGVISGDDEYKDRTVVEFWTPNIAHIAYMGEVAMKSPHNGEPLVNIRYDFSAKTDSSKQNVRRAVAGTLGYEPGLQYIRQRTNKAA